MKGTSIYWLFFVLLIAMTGWMFWQQSRQQKNRRQVQSTLQSGQQVVTVGGIIGTVETVEENSCTLRIADGVAVTVLKSSIGGQYPAGGSVR